MLFFCSNAKEQLTNAASNQQAKKSKNEATRPISKNVRVAEKKRKAEIGAIDFDKPNDYGYKFSTRKADDTL